MNPNHLTAGDKSTLLSKVGLNTKLTQGLFVRLLFQFFLLIGLAVSQSAFAAPVITNTATANYTINGNSLNLTDSVQFTKDTVVVPTDTIELVKSSNLSSALIGDTISYTLTVKNPNPRILNNVNIEDTLPLGLSYQSGTAKINNVTLNSSDVSISSNIVNFTIGDIQANTNLSLTYQAIIGTNTPEGNVINKAVVSSDTATSPLAQANVVVSKPIVVVPLILNKTVNLENVNIGETVRYSLSIENPNAFDVADAVVEDILPAGLNYIVGSAKFNNNNITATINNTLSFSFSNIPSSNTSVLVYDAVVESLVSGDHELVNTAKVTAADPSANSNTSSATINIEDDSLTLTKSTPSTDVVENDIIDYTVTLTNPLSRALTNLVIKDTLPTGFIYQTNSASLNNIALQTSQVSTSGNLVDFMIGSLDPSTSIVLTYKVKVSENAIPGENTNTAKAVSDYAASLTADAMVKLRTPSTITFYKISNSGVSSLIQPTSYNTNQQGGKNFEEINNITLLNGSSITLPVPQPIVLASQYTTNEPVVIEVTDLDQNLDPNELDTIEVTINVPGTNDTEILLLTETSINSGVFRGLIITSTGNTNIQDGSLTIADGVEINVNYRDEEDNSDTSVNAALVIPDTTLQIEKTADKEYSAIGELVRYTITFNNTTGFDLDEFYINDLLPIGFRYIPNTAELNGDRLNNNVNFNGRALTIKLNNMPTDASWQIEYVTKISAGTQIGDAINTAYLSSGNLRSNDAQAVVTIKDDLMTSKNILTGRVYIGCKTKSSKKEVPPKVLGEARIYMETGRSVLTDNEGFWHMENVNPGAHVLQLDTESIPGYEPLLCDDNTRRAQDAKSHFVDLQKGNLWHVDFHVKPISGYKDPTSNLQLTNEALNPSTLFDKKYLESASEGFEILWPKNNFVPAVASTKIFVKHSPKHKVELVLNGNKVNALNYDGSDTNKARTISIKRWIGVDIDITKKNNKLEVILKDKSGKEIDRKTHNIHFSSNPASAKLISDKSILIADGKTTPVITLQIKDEDGFPMRANTHGYFNIENNKYKIKVLNTSDDEVRELNAQLSGDFKYDIGENGYARIELNPTTQTGEVKLNLQFIDSDNKRSTSEIKAWLKPALREWIMVGIAEGTATQELIKGNMHELSAVNKEPDFSKRGRVAFFAKGKIQGKYLLTIAYDTHKKNQEVGSQLNGNIDPDAFYTIYADNSNSQYEAPSSEKLYLKLEKNDFYAMFGDYQTEMTITELAKYQRTLNGIKTEFRGKQFNYNGFISETSNNHHREEIPGDGTSGLYQLNNKIIPNSDTISIETRDRFNSDRVILNRELTRYQDYNIDYDAGTLFFKFPITSRDSDFNPNIIVVNYDSEEDTNKSITAGGRVAVKSKDGKLETGISLIHEGNNNTRDNQLIASDLTYQVTADTELHLEIAQSKTESSDYQKRSAYIVELEKQIQEMEAKFYYKKQESNFGIDSQGSETGLEKAGAEVSYRMDTDTAINSELSVQKNLDNDNKRRLAQVDVTRQFNQYEVKAGLRHTNEELDGDNSTTNEIENNTLLLGGKYTSDNNKVTLRTDLEKNLSSNDGSEINPDRLIVGVDVRVGKGFTVFAEHETTDNGNIKTHNNRIGVTKDLWKGAKGRTTYTQERTDEGQRNYATLGLSQTVKLTDKINADFSVDQTKTITSNTTQQSFNNDEPAIQGSEQDDYLAFSVGLGSNDKDVSWTTRFEIRDGDQTDKVNFLASAIRYYENGKNISAKLSYYNSEDRDGDYDQSAKLSFGGAWHPKEKDFVILSRLDFVSDKSSTSDDANSINSDETGTKKIIHNMHFNKKVNKKTRVGLHHGIKYIKDENNSTTSSSTIDTATIAVRRDINDRWDIGVHGGYLKDWDNDSREYVAGASIGVSPSKNVWVELGYNFEGFTDTDFDSNKYTSEGVYIDFRYKFDQDSLRKGVNFLRRGKASFEENNDASN